MLVIHRSNRIEVLADEIAQVLADPRGAPVDPLAPETIVVPSRGMSVWLAMRMAERFGVWAGAEFPFPRRFMARVLAAVLGPQADPVLADERHRLPFFVLPQIERHIDTPAFAELRRYCRDDVSGLARWQLAVRMAGLFEQYLVLRPEMLLAWERGEGDDWQAELWRATVGARGDQHFARLFDAAMNTLAGAAPALGHLPARICVFGIASLPSTYLRLFDALARHRDVHFFIPSPSRAWWSDIRSARDRLRRSAREGSPSAPPPEEGNPLLASWGTVAREFQALLESQTAYVDAPGDLYRDPSGTGMLATLQADILDLRWRGSDPLGRGTEPPRVLAPDDRSIAAFSCHSRMREVEVLHDRLLDLLAADPTLAPRDIVVLMTDVDTYAPLVEAVFERERDDPTHLPWSITDRSARASSPTLEAWTRILGMGGGRAQISEVLDLLLLEPVQLRLGIVADDVDTVAQWFDDVGIRWGIDARHRAAHGQPKVAQSTWSFGLERLLLGWAMPGGGRDSFAGVLPYDEIEGERGLLLGKIAAFCADLFEIVTDLERPRSLARWQLDLGSVLDRMIAPRPSAQWELDGLRSALAAVAEAGQAAGFDAPLPLAVVREAVLARVEADHPLRGFLSGGVTFCGIVPMRAIPARVIAVIGLGDRDFPRATPPADFDRIASAPRVGDRSGRDDDRYAFLEAVLACRQTLLLGYVGQSSQDDSDLPPSVVVAELLDALADAFVVPGAPNAAVAVRRHVVARQPMQPFSPRNFGADPDPRLASYATAYLDGARALLSGDDRSSRPPLFRAPLPPTPLGEPLEFDLFTRFFHNPAKELLKRRLRVNFSSRDRERSDLEPVEIDELAQWKLGDELLALQADQIPPDRARELLRAGGGLPIGTIGDVMFEDLAAIAAAILRHRPENAIGRRSADATVSVDLDLGALRVRGHLRDVHGDGLAITTFSRPRAKHLLDLWIRHLVLCAARPGRPVRSVLAGRGAESGTATVFAFEPVAAPMPLLLDLAELWAVGQREPLLLFPQSSLAFAEAFAVDPNPEASLAAARRAFSEGRHPERSDDAILRAFGDDDVLAVRYDLFGRTGSELGFVYLAVRVFAPILQHRRTT